jgi:anti-sigma regulatory factor (Ser/Thr protein kinase)
MAHVPEQATKHANRRFVWKPAGDKSHENSGNGRQVISTTRNSAGMITQATTDRTDISRIDQAYLAALTTSAGWCRLFARHVCSSWQFDEDRIGIAELLMSELASNAIQHSGVPEPQRVNALAYAELKLIGVRLLEFRDSLVIEVWDTSQKPPVLLEPDYATERGRGLQLVDALSIRWGHYDARMGGKVVWCQIAGADSTNADQNTHEGTYQEVLEALQAHGWNEQA